MDNIWRTLFLDKNGNLSSKRVFGVTLLIFGLAWGFSGSLVQNEIMVDFSKWVLGTGAAPLVATVAERKT